MNVDWNLLLLLAALLMCPLMHLWMAKKNQHCSLRNNLWSEVNGSANNVPTIKVTEVSAVNLHTSHKFLLKRNADE